MGKQSTQQVGHRMTTINDGPSANDGGSLTVANNSPSRDSNTSLTIKLGLLIVLCLQNAVYSMLRRYSLDVREEKWTYSSVLLVGEVIKLVVSTFMTLMDTSSSSAEGTCVAKLCWLVRASLPMFVPAFVYWNMNLLSYESLKRVDASTFTVFAQMKILTTALFSVILMGRRFHPRKWRALFLLVLGVVLVSNGSAPASDPDSDPASDPASDSNVQYLIGVAAVLTEVTLSGFVSVFFEKVLKSRVVHVTVWDRNFQLALYSIVGYSISGNLPMAIMQEGGFFKGWTVNAAILSVIGSAGGLLVAFTTKYTSAVLKTFATSGAIIVTAVAGHVFLGSPLDIPIAIGAGCTVLSLLNYSDEGDPQPPASGAAQKSNPAVEPLAKRSADDGSAEPLLVSLPPMARDSAA